MNFRSVYFQLSANDLERAKKFCEDVFKLEVARALNDLIDKIDTALKPLKCMYTITTK